MNHPVNAVVDTAAQISMVRKGLLDDHWGTQELSINTAEEDASMKCQLLPDVKFSIGDQQYTHSFARGPICDDCILGLDFLLSCKAVVDLPTSMLFLKGCAVDVSVQRNNRGEDYHVSRVAAAENTTIPARSRKLVEVKLDNQAKVPFVTNPISTDQLLLGSFLLDGECNSFVEIINDSAKDVLLKKDQHLTNAVELKEILYPGPSTEAEPSRDEEDEATKSSVISSISRGAAGLSNGGTQSLCPEGAAGLPAARDGVTTIKVSESQFSVIGSTKVGKNGSQTGVEWLPPKIMRVENGGDEKGSKGAAWLPYKVDKCGEVSGSASAAGLSPTWSSDGRCYPPKEEYVVPGPQSELPDWKVVDEINDTGPPQSRTFVPPVTMSEIELQEMCRSAHDEVPKHVKTIFDEACQRLSTREQIAVARLLTVYGNMFSQDKTDLGMFTLLTHRIQTYNEEPVKERLRRTPLKFQKEEEKTLNEMLKAGVIEPSFSEWASAPVLVRKKDGEVRYTVDFRQVNTKTVKDAYPLPLIDECTDTLSGNLWFHTLDLASGYWQIAIHPEDRHKTAFLTKYGLFQHVRMAQGLCNAPATFQRVMHLVLRGLTWNKALVYLDDIVLGKTFEESLENLEVVLQRIGAHNLKLKPKKCQLFCTQVQFLGRTVSRDGVAITNDHVECVLNWPIPKDQNELERFLGFVNYHRDFVPGLSELLTPLYALTKRGTDYSWTHECDRVFQELKLAMTQAPVLAYPNDTDPYVLDTDASDQAVGAALYQVQQGQERPISFASSSLTPAQRKYCTTRKELLAVVVFTRRFRHYLLGRHFTVRTDHGSLTWLCRFKNPCGQLGRWLEELAQYDMTIEHRAGSKHVNADSLSRIPPSTPVCNNFDPTAELASLPCGGCDYCTKLHRQWCRFESDVDFVTPFFTRCLGVRGGDSQSPDGRCMSAMSEFLTGGENTSDQLFARRLSGADVQSTPGGEEGSRSSNYMQSFSPEELRTMQMSDPELCPVMVWLETEEPTQQELFPHGFTTKYLWRHREHLRMKDGVLSYAWVGTEPQQLVLVVPLCEREEVIRLCHDTKIGGHWGRDKTILRISKTCYWPTLKRDVELYVLTCAVCNQQKNRRRHRTTMMNYQAGYPGERIHMDFLGPFTTSSNGNRYILSIVDQFTKWIEVCPTPDQSAELTAQILVEKWIARFGVPRVIHTDQGRTFESHLFKGLCDHLEITKTRTTPYRPSSNGQVERYNQQIASFIRCFLENKAETWDQYIGLLGMSLRATVSAATGFTPNMMFLGREVTLPMDILYGIGPGKYESPPEYVKAMLTKMTETFTAARENMSAAQTPQ